MEQPVIRTHSLDDVCHFMPTLQAPLTGQLVCWWPVISVTPTLHSVLPTALEMHSTHGCQSPTSIVVFAVTTGSFHGRVAASSSPAQLADAVPPIQVQGTSAIAIAQAGTTLCKAKHTESRYDHPQPPGHIHAHSACQLTKGFHIHQRIDARSTRGGLSLERPLYLEGN